MSAVFSRKSKSQMAQEYSQVSIDLETLIGSNRQAYPSTMFSIRRLVFALASCCLLAYLIVDDPVRPKTPHSNQNTIVEENTPSSSQTLTQPSKCIPFKGKPSFQYALMLDAGSTGSRIHIYKFNYCQSESPVIESEIFEQVKPGLSSYAHDVHKAAESIKPLLDLAVKEIPFNLRKCTPIALKATAGLRLLGDETSKKILSTIRDFIASYNFSIYKDDGVAVMDGKDEGVYAWITINYLLKNIGQATKKPTAAIMDLGGGSTQIVFEPIDGTFDPSIKSAQKFELKYGGFVYNLYQNSYLGYGLNEGRKTVKGTIVRRNETSSPCIPKGVDQVMTIDEIKYSIKGTAFNSSDCTKLVSSILFSKTTTCPTKPCSFDGIYQPLLKDVYPKNTGRDIYAFSYFYDRIFPLDAKDTTTVSRARELAELVCKKDHSHFKEDIVEELNENSDWCLDLSFIHGLLGVGYELEEERQLHLAKKIDGYETGWCLGATLQMIDSGSMCEIN